MEVEYVIEPLFSFDSKELVADINSEKGNVCYVRTTALSPKDPRIPSIKADYDRVVRGGKEIVNIAYMDKEALESTLSYVDNLLKNNITDDRWNRVYTILEVELIARRRK